MKSRDDSYLRYISPPKIANHALDCQKLILAMLAAFGVDIRRKGGIEGSDALRRHRI